MFTHECKTTSLNYFLTHFSNTHVKMEVDRYKESDSNDSSKDELLEASLLFFGWSQSIAC